MLVDRLAEAQPGTTPEDRLLVLLAVAGSIRAVVARFVRTVDHKLPAAHSLLEQDQEDLVDCLAEEVHRGVLVAEQVLVVLVAGRMCLAKEGTLLAVEDLDPEDLAVRNVAHRRSFEEVDDCSSCREGNLVLVVIVGTVHLAEKGLVMGAVEGEGRLGAVDTTGSDFEAVVDRTVDTGSSVDRHIEHWEGNHPVVEAVRSSHLADHTLEEDHMGHWDQVEGNFREDNSLIPDKRLEAVVLEHS